jgi:hypothetical protein
MHTDINYTINTAIHTSKLTFHIFPLILPGFLQYSMSMKWHYYDDYYIYNHSNLTES